MSSLNQMLADYGRCPLLTAAQEIHLGSLVRRWRDWEGGPELAPPAVQKSGRRARDTFIRANTRLVVTVAKKYCRSDFNDERLQEHIQNGMLGLARAAEKFDHARGYKFSTYAYWWITQSIGRAAESEGMIRIPGSALQQYRALERAIAQLQHENRKPTPELLSELTGMTTSAIANRLEIGKVKLVKSLDAQSGQDGEGSSLLELLVDPTTCQAEEVEDQVDLESLRTWLERNKQCLTPKQAIAIELTMQGKTHKQIAADLGCSRAGAGLHISQAKTRIRNHYATAA
jgi:RNA polymerase primary sigma factor